MSVKRAQREIDSHEFTEWMAYYSLDPFGNERSDLQAGIIASTVANCHREKNAEPFKASDFMLQPEKAPIDPDEVDPELVAKKIRAAVGAFVKSKGN